jgi:hypothetical protein
MVIANMIYFKIMTWKIIKMLKIDVYPMLIKISKNLLIAVLSGIIGLLCYNYFNQFGEGN